MGNEKRQVLDKKEVETIRKTIEKQKYTIKLVELKKRRIELDLEELPYRKDMYEKEVERAELEIKSLKKTIEDAEKIIRGEY